MQIETTTRERLSVIHVRGSMDALSVNEFDNECKRVLDDGAQGVVVEMSGLEYISSAGLRGILILAKMAQAKGVKLAFAGMRDMVLDMFKLSGFMTILSVHEEESTAVSHVL